MVAFAGRDACPPMAAPGVIVLDTVYPELADRGVLHRGEAWAGERHTRRFRPAWASARMQRHAHAHMPSAHWCACHMCTCRVCGCRCAHTGWLAAVPRLLPAGRQGSQLSAGRHMDPPVAIGTTSPRPPR
jgi:hypothetical protein